MFLLILDDITMDLTNRINYLLNRLEWSGTYSYCTGYPCCPICKGIKPGHGIDHQGNDPLHSGHDKDCPYYGLFDES